MEAINTFIFLDLETSGLPQCSPTKITEIALVAAGREHILEKHKGIFKENAGGNDFLPRVLAKVNLPVYPCKMIQPMASSVSGLTNEGLEQQKPFDEGLYNMMVLFMERLAKPICFVAHNGDRFDFPILQSEMFKLGKTFSDDVFCADSLPAFRQILSNEPIPDNCCRSTADDKILNGIKPLNSNCLPSSLLSRCEWSNEDYDKEMAQAAELAEKLYQEQSSLNKQEIELQMKTEMDRIRKINEQTPTRKSRKPTEEQPRKVWGVRRKVLNDSRQPRMNYKLKTLYESLTEKEMVNAHRAEVDALALLECVTAVGRPILEWMDSNRIPFRSVKKMW